MLLPYMETGRIEAGCDEAGRGFGGCGIRLRRDSSGRFQESGFKR